MNIYIFFCLLTLQLHVKTPMIIYELVTRSIFNKKCFRDTSQQHRLLPDYVMMAHIYNICSIYMFDKLHFKHNCCYTVHVHCSFPKFILKTKSESENLFLYLKMKHRVTIDLLHAIFYMRENIVYIYVLYFD